LPKLLFSLPVVESIHPFEADNFLSENGKSASSRPSEILKPLWPLLEPEYSDKVPGVFPEIDFFAGQGLYPLRRGSRNVLQYRNRVFYQVLLKIGCSEMHTIQKNNP
jgi:hypothetical protein